MRTTKAERKDNAISFYRNFMHGNYNKIAVVVERTESSNPCISRCRFIARVTPLAMVAPLVIAESTMGVEGCFIELLSSIRSCPQKTYHEDGFDKWLKDTYGFSITYRDGLVFMFER